jgi:Fe-S oxidoreductase
MATEIQYFGFLPGYVLFWGVFIIALGLFSYRMKQLLQYMFVGEKEKGNNGWKKRIGGTLGYVFSQICQLKNFRTVDRAPLGHAFMAWGFFVFVIFYFFFIILAEGFGLTGIEHTNFFFYYAWIMDILAVLIVIGAGWGLIRRFIVRPDRLKGEQTIESLIILLSVFTHPFTHLFKEATNIAMGSPPSGLGHTLLPPVSSWFSNLFTGTSVAAWHNGFFWAHWLTVLIVLVLIPYTRYLHMIASIFNGILRPTKSGTVLKPIDFESAESYGAAKITDLTWKQNLDLYSCVVCGNCQENCPAFITGKPLNPKTIIQDLKKHLLKVGPELVKTKNREEMSNLESNSALVDNVIDSEAIWACTTCGMCDTVCPVWVDHIDKIVDLRRNLVLEKSAMPETAESALRSIEDRGHPWRGTALTRTDWTEGLDINIMSENSDVDVLFWVGCTEALEERSTKIARATALIMKEAGVSFGILGMEESCCGDPARRIGNEYLFQMQAEKNIEVMKSYNVKTIVTACPHCYNTIKNEYPQFGGNFKVLHHTELIDELIREGKLKISGELKETITYHDSCYLGRHNNIYEQPRNILKGISGVNMVEMKKNHKWSFCCGAGGGRMWMEERTGQRISENRIDQAIETKAGTIATACPFCMQMFDDAIKAKEKEEQIVTKDIAEIIVESMNIPKD